ncbi:MAG: D-glycero-beta-D-manno-heptose-7-phosphate kinase, partial [Flavobacteriales bacterium]|nr:D-glycero-beta-D-manno-heptose-7-phosphate kinase [Flavobacteriales bacterium]
MSLDVNALFDQFSQQRILVVGDVMIDAYMRGKVSRVSPEAPVPIVNLEKTEDRLGGAANVALNLASLGA